MGCRLVTESYVLGVFYGENRPKSENWATLMRRTSATVCRREKLSDLGNSLALGLQRGVNIIILQCIPWPVACSEWRACLTDFDRSWTFRFSGSGIRTMIRIGLKSWSVRPCPDICRHAKFHLNPCARCWVILLTDRQTSWAIAYSSSYVRGKLPSAKILDLFITQGSTIKT